MLSCQSSGNLQSTPVEHNLATFSNTSATLTSTCDTCGTVYRYIHIYFLIEVNDSDCLLSSILHRCSACQALKGHLTLFVRISVFLLGLSVAQIQFTWFCTFKKHQLKCWTARKVPLSCQPGLWRCRELLAVLFATQSPLDWNSPVCSWRPQPEQCSCGALVKGVVILAKYWLCLSALSLTSPADYVGWVSVLRKERTESSGTDGHLRVWLHNSLQCSTVVLRLAQMLAKVCLWAAKFNIRAAVLLNRFAFLSKLFKAVWGGSPLQYVLKWRQTWKCSLIPCLQLTETESASTSYTTLCCP